MVKLYTGSLKFIDVCHVMKEGMKAGDQMMAENKGQNALNNRAYFFDEGIRFTCQRCGACCTGAPGTIYVCDEEIIALGRHLALDRSELIQRYLYPFKDSFSIREDPQGCCLFFNAGCTIYDLRPHQCRTFPFWFENLRSAGRWKKIAGQCPGVGRGRLHSREEILTTLKTTFFF